MRKYMSSIFHAFMTVCLGIGLLAFIGFVSWAIGATLAMGHLWGYILAIIAGVLLRPHLSNRRLLHIVSILWHGEYRRRDLHVRFGGHGPTVHPEPERDHEVSLAAVALAEQGAFEAAPSRMRLHVAETVK